MLFTSFWPVYLSTVRLVFLQFHPISHWSTAVFQVLFWQSKPGVFVRPGAEKRGVGTPRTRGKYVCSERGTISIINFNFNMRKYKKAAITWSVFEINEKRSLTLKRSLGSPFPFLSRREGSFPKDIQYCPKGLDDSDSLSHCWHRQIFFFCPANTHSPIQKVYLRWWIASTGPVGEALDLLNL